MSAYWVLNALAHWSSQEPYGVSYPFYWWATGSQRSNGPKFLKPVRSRGDAIPGLLNPKAIVLHADVTAWCSQSVLLTLGVRGPLSRPCHGVCNVYFVIVMRRSCLLRCVGAYTDESKQLWGAGAVPQAATATTQREESTAGTWYKSIDFIRF